MKKLITAAFCTIALGLYGCSGDDSDPVSPGTTVDHGYYPLTEGSSWTYDAFLSGGPAQVIHQVKGDSIINAKKYYKYVQFNNGEIRYSYLRRSNDTLLVYSFSEETPGDMIMLIEKGVGTQWSTYNRDFGFESSSTYRIIAKKDSYTVNNTVYNDVLQVRIDQTISGWGQNGTMVSDVYFAKNIGMIASESNSQYARLTKYTVK